jgi:sterol desaturase/sphingolipid hydroxylase (fatty acid hydroxylase superfamily)
MILFALPAITFIGLYFLEKLLPTIQQSHIHQKWDHLLNAIGLLIQGCAVPAFGYWISQEILPCFFANGKRIFPLGWWGSFWLNFLFVDFLYYWQHRAFHRSPALWNLHKCHHAAKRVDIWTTSRNSILINFLFVYCLINPILAYFCDTPIGFYTGAMITASLDVFRHCRLDLNQILPGKWLYILSHIFVLPRQHHHHHGPSHQPVNFSANFIFWDILFKTAEINPKYPADYGVNKSAHPVSQLFYPISKK